MRATANIGEGMRIGYLEVLSVLGVMGGLALAAVNHKGTDAAHAATKPVIERLYWISPKTDLGEMPVSVLEAGVATVAIAQGGIPLEVAIDPHADGQPVEPILKNDQPAKLIAVGKPVS